ncbi:hypothetical protein V6R21_27880 [Limibacter armeniacum]|uniref:hypothetical protein n=1 Tax=Limibacter armeniacum TaxID=466084 RepID=UPI002FE5B1A4
MTTEEKKAYLLLKSVIFHKHGLDESEQQILNETAIKLDAHTELDWANQFIEEDYCNAFERARAYLLDKMMELDKDVRLDYLSKVWEANDQKGYVSEIEATAMLKLAADWDIERAFINAIKSLSAK